MSRAFWVEVLGRGGEVASRHAFEEGATVGRGYGNDVVVDDPYVAPAQLAFERDAEGILWVRDLDTPNGTFDAIRRRDVTRLAVADEALLRVGQTILRVRTAAFQPPPTLPLARHVSPGRRQAHLALGLMAAFIAAAGIEGWLAQTGEFKLALYMPVMVMLPLMLMAWAGGWALVSRIITSQGHFFRHLVIVLAVMLVLIAIDAVVDFIAYAFAANGIKRWLPYLGWTVLGALAILHMRLVVPRHPRAVTVAVVSLVAAAIAVHATLRAESERTQMQRLAAELMPPFLLLKSPAAPADFFRDTASLVPRLEEERKKEPGSSLFSPDFD